MICPIPNGIVVRINTPLVANCSTECRMGPTTKSTTDIETKMEINGVTIRSIIVGTTFRKFLSTLDSNHPAKIPGRTDPWYPTIFILKPNSESFIGSAAPEATAHALGNCGATIINPTTIPKIGFPPNRFVAEYVISTGRKANAISVNISNNVANSGDITTPKLLINPLIPINNPVVTKAGINGIRTSPKILINFCKGFIFA